jgi:hypothetical protein
MSPVTPSLKDEVLAPAGLMCIITALISAGCICFALAQGDTSPDALAKMSGSAWLGLSVVLPLGLASYLWLDIQHTEVPQFYREEKTAMMVCLGGAGAGGITANILFVLVTLFLPSVLAGADPRAIHEALMSSVGWSPALILFLSSLAVGFVIGKLAPGKVPLS